MTHELAFAGLTDPGPVRQGNEDRWHADAESGLFVVADGLGGHAAGGAAAQIVVDALPALIRRRRDRLADRNAGAILASSISQLGATIWRDSHGRAGVDGMGSTVVAALYFRNAFWIAHLGDSRACLLRHGVLDRLTRDHTPMGLATLSPVEEARVHPALKGLTGYVGMANAPEPDVVRLQALPGDRLLLCSDGVHGMLDDIRIGSLLEQAATPAQACENLVAAANAAGGRDNVTAVVVAVLPENPESQ